MYLKELINRFSFQKISFCHNVISENIKFQMPCIGYVLKGQARFIYNGNVYIATAGDLIYIAAGTNYFSSWSGEPDIEWYSVNYSFSGKQTMAEYKFQIIKNYPSQLFHDMFNTYENDKFLCVCSFYRLLDDLSKKLCPSKKSTTFNSIKPAIEYIENHSKEEISINKLSNLCCCSESTLFKSFQSTVGVSPIKYKHNIMIQNSLLMILDTDLSIEEISRECGFSSSNYFRAIFKEITGTTPKKMRNYS